MKGETPKQEGHPMTTPINRREFLGRSAAGGLALGLGAQHIARAASANETVTLGVVGLSRGASVARSFANVEHCTVKTVCDVDRQRVARCAESLEEQTGTAPDTETDFRRLLEDPDIDAVAFALPAHWHAPASILACQAGKHVYVEKPCCHNPREGELLVAAARRYDRAVQMGTQRRSWPAIREAMARLHDGVIGRAYYARSWYGATRGSIGRGSAATPPDQLDYDLWQGPAPRRPYKDNLVHYNWHWHWHWGTGELGNNGVHAIDLCRWGLEADYPERVVSAGGRYHFDDDQETPDTHTVSFDFAGGKSITWDGLSCVRPSGPNPGFGVEFYGENGSLRIDGGGYSIRDKGGQELESHEGPSSDEVHCSDFLAAIRTGAHRDLQAEIEEGYKSTLLPLLGNIAHRTGAALTCGEEGRIVGNPEAEALWQRDYEPGWEPVA